MSLLRSLLAGAAARRKPAATPAEPARKPKAAPKPAPKPEHLEIGGREIALTLKVSPTARRLTLRLDSRTGGLVVVRPRACPRAEALNFVRAQSAWIAARLAQLPPRVPFSEGSVVPLLGRSLTIRSAPAARRGVWVEGDTLAVSGFPENLERRVAAWLRARAKAEIEPRARALAARLGKPVRRVTFRDTRSRWGSCSASGDLSFSWRLILAPEFVLDYVVAHEVAHLAELNHSPRFWAVVRDLGSDPVLPRQWLKAHGNDLFRYGA